MRSGVLVGGKFALHKGVRWAARCFRGPAASGYRGRISSCGPDGNGGVADKMRFLTLASDAIESSMIPCRSGWSTPGVDRGLQGLRLRMARPGQVSR